MPSTLHDRFLQEIRQYIDSQLERARSQPDTFGEWSRNIGSDGSADIPLDLTGLRLDRSKRSPDMSYGHNRAQFPGLVIEVSYSQKAKDLPRLADDYILGSDGSIKTVVGFDLDYKDSATARVYVWQPRYTTDPRTLQSELSSQLVYESVSRRPCHISSLIE